MSQLNRTNVLAAAWGFAEATLFFIVPDVLISWIALQRWRQALWACAWALVGALTGGTIIWIFGFVNPESLRTIFTQVPAINDAMIADVARQLDDRGMVALFMGPLIGVPYKIYALEAAGGGFGLLIFLLVSIPARLMRFVVVAIVAGAASHALRRFIGLRVIRILHVIVWVAFYSWYFHAMAS